jgi:class 3 adenylate cyclase/tetratricopeptide (TPR) repeat protein
VTCERCGNANATGRRFCDACGAALVATCSDCGAQNRPGARFCGDCGAQLAGGAGELGDGGDASAGPAGGAATPQAAGTAGSSGGQPAGSANERRLVSVLFVDLVGFTPYAETRDPEEVRETLDRYFDLARSIVDRYGGAIEKFIGDAVMAVWGTPVAHEDDAERAVRAALDLVAAVPEVGEGLLARGGIMTGEAAVDREARGQAMVAGDLVNTAARFQGAAQAGTVLVGESTVRAAGEAIAFEVAGEQLLKGKAGPVATWRALRVVAQRRGAGRATRLEAPFVGRDEELRLLKELLHATGRDPRPRLVSVTGPAGIGKSRLAWELEKYIDGIVERVWWHHGRSPAYGDGIAFWALVEMVRGRADLAEGDDEPTTRAGLRATLDRHIADPDEHDRIEAALLALLGLEPPPPGGREVLFEAWRTFFERIADSGTTVLVFEDLQWADPGLIDFVEYLHEWSRRVPLLIVTLARPELFDRRADWGAGKRSFSAIALEPIAPDAMRELIRGLVPELPMPAVEAIVARADGVPLYAVEFVRSLVGTGRLAEDGAVLRPIGDLTDLAMPESLRSLVAARLDVLDAADRALLQDAAVLGRSFTPLALAAIRGVEPDDIEPRLEALVRGELLDRNTDPRSSERGQYLFVQALIREVAYETLARRERRARHLAAARHFEAAGGTELADALAEHLLAAHAASAPGEEADAVAAQARLALGAAADRALALGSPDQALARLEQALRITAEGPARLDLLDRASDAAVVGARYERAEEHARAAVAGRAGMADQVAAARSTNRLATAELEGGQGPTALAIVDEALARLPPGSDAAEAALRSTRTRCLYRLSRNKEAADEGWRAIALAESLDDRAMIAEAMANTAGGVIQMTQPHLGIALLREAIVLAESTGQVRLALRCRSNLAVAMRSGDQRLAIPAFEEVLASVRRVGDRGTSAWAVSHLVDLLCSATLEWDRALELATATLAEAEAPMDRALVVPTLIYIAAYRGEPVAEMLRDFDALVEPLADEFALSLNRASHALVAFVRDDPRVTLAVATGEATRSSGALMGFVMLYGIWAAARSGDLAGLAVIQAALPRAEWISPRYQAATERAIAGIAACFEDRPDDAVSAFVEAIAGYRGMGDQVTAADLGLMFAELLPDRPEARAAAAVSREVYAKVGARPMIDRIDAALAGQPVRAHAPGNVAPAVAEETI